MISDRDLNRIEHEMQDLSYYSIETDILRELLDCYRDMHPKQKDVAKPLPPPARSKMTDD